MKRIILHRLVRFSSVFILFALIIIAFKLIQIFQNLDLLIQ